MGKKIIDFAAQHDASRGRKSKAGGKKSKAVQLYTTLQYGTPGSEITAILRCVRQERIPLRESILKPVQKPSFSAIFLSRLFFCLSICVTFLAPNSLPLRQIHYTHRHSPDELSLSQFLS